MERIHADAHIRVSDFIRFKRERRRSPGKPRMPRDGLVLPRRNIVERNRVAGFRPRHIGARSDIKLRNRRLRWIEWQDPFVFEQHHAFFGDTARGSLMLFGVERTGRMRSEHLTDVAPDFNVRDFDISPDGREIVLEQVNEQSDVVLLEIPGER